MLSAQLVALVGVRHQQAAGIFSTTVARSGCPAPPVMARAVDSKGLVRDERELVRVEDQRVARDARDRLIRAGEPPVDHQQAAVRLDGFRPS